MMMKKQSQWHVTFQRPIAYDVIKTNDLFHPQNPALVSVGRIQGSHRFIVIDQSLESAYAARIKTYFSHHGIVPKLVALPGGEEHKTLDSYLAILNELDTFPIHRRDEPVIVMGGGVLTDVVGFVASSYRRGIPHINIPTTLMAYIDAAIGIKTAINFNGHKNRLGAFEPPLKVYLDKSFLRSLPKRHLLNGLYEILKLAIIADLDLFGLLEEKGLQSIREAFQNDGGDAILDQAVTRGLTELEPNLFEECLDRKMDFGHTFSYGLETRAGADLLHGEAVLLDIIISLLIAHNRGLLSDPELERIFKLIGKLCIVPDTRSIDPGLLWQCLEERIRHRNGLQRVPLPDRIGGCTFVNDINRAEIETALSELSTLKIQTV